MIYYVEDDDNIRDLTVYALRKQGIEAEGFSCDGEFKAAVARRVPDAVLLDIMLPDTDGLAIMRRLRADRLTATVPIMMLTAKDTELDKVMALDGGADDYLTKPFAIEELFARIRVALKRSEAVRAASGIGGVGAGTGMAGGATGSAAAIPPVSDSTQASASPSPRHARRGLGRARSRPPRSHGRRLAHRTHGPRVRRPRPAYGACRNCANA